MKNLILSKKAITIVMLMVWCTLNIHVPVVQAGVIDTTKKYANKVMFWKDEHLQEITFNNIYPKSIYKKSYFSIVILGTSIVVGGAFSYISLGGGAPVAATGVSSVASWIAGGGAGSYMAGLSMVGSTVGGNAITGAVILNGLSYGIIGGTMGKFAALPIAAKFGVIANITSVMMDGIAIIENPDTGELHYIIRLKLPKKLGGKKVRELVDIIYDVEEEIFEANKDGNMSKVKIYTKIKELHMQTGEELLQKALQSNEPSQEDLLVLGMICYQKGAIELFQKSMQKLSEFEVDLDDTGFLDYLNAINNLLNRKYEEASLALESSIRQNPYALEPIALYINILSDELSKSESKMLKLIEFAEKNYDSDKYSGSYSLLAPYFRMGTIYYINQRYSEAIKFYEKAHDEIGFIQSLFGADELENQIQLAIANSYYQLGETEEADKIYEDIMEDLEGNQLKNVQQQYAGNS